MQQQYNIEQWQLARDSELHNSLYRSGDPRHETGIKVHCWGGWRWTHEGTEYRTDAEGSGLWIRLSTGDWSQCRGTGQFDLPRDRGAAIRKLRRLGLGPDGG